MLEFNEELHEYSLDGKILPSVTQIIQSSGELPTNFYTTQGRDRGTEIHRLTHVYDLTGEILDSPYSEYVEQYAKFLKDSKAVVITCEERVYSNLGYAGTLDRIVELNGQLMIIDIKTGAKAKWHSYQIGAYSIPKMIQKGGILRLQPKKYYLDVIKGDDLILAQKQFIELLNKFRRENLC